MKLSRLFGLIVGVVLAMSLVMVAAASAAAPEFKSSAGFPVLFLGLSLLGTLESEKQKVECGDDHIHGFILGPHTVSGIEIEFLGCTAKEGEKAGCPAKSPGSATGDIATNLLDGELGAVTTTEAASGVGQLFLPEKGKVFTTIVAACIAPEESAVEGQVAGEVVQLNALVSEQLIVLTGSKGTQSIKSIGILGTTVKPKLTSFGAIPSSEGDVNHLDFPTAKVEVT